MVKSNFSRIGHISTLYVCYWQYPTRVTFSQSLVLPEMWPMIEKQTALKVVSRISTCNGGRACIRSSSLTRSSSHSVDSVLLHVYFLSRYSIHMVYPLTDETYSKVT